MRSRIRPRLAACSLAVAGAMSLGPMALAAEPVSAEPWVFDPTNTGIAQAQWVTGEGLEDAGKSAHALKLVKNGETNVLAAAGATIPFEGKLHKLGFDYRNDGWCGAGAPRMNVHTADQGDFWFGCAHGDRTTPDDGWTRVQFGDEDEFPATSGAEWPGFEAGVEVTGIDIVFDEGTDAAGTPESFAYLDNININGTFIGKPGVAK
jgi:hypothetical protein